MFGWFRRCVRKIGIFGVEVEFHPPTDTPAPKSEPKSKPRPVVDSSDTDEEETCDEVHMPSSGGAGDNKYGQAAIRAVELYRMSGGRMTPPEAWDTATTELFGVGTPAQQKGCPKGAFLGLCQVGYVAGIPGGSYSRSVKNSAYAVRAAELLAREPALATNWAELWRRVLAGVTKQHNSQMHVVTALWNSGLLSGPAA